jgi:hypothetical protein
MSVMCLAIGGMVGWAACLAWVFFLESHYDKPETKRQA